MKQKYNVFKVRDVAQVVMDEDIIMVVADLVEVIVMTLDIKVGIVEDNILDTKVVQDTDRIMTQDTKVDMLEDKTQHIRVILMRKSMKQNTKVVIVKGIIMAKDTEVVIVGTKEITDEIID